MCDTRLDKQVCGDVQSGLTRGASSDGGFTLVELLISLVMVAVVAWALTAVLIHSAHSRGSTMNQSESEQSASAALSMIARDVRSAGYGADTDSPSPQPAIAYVDQQELIVSANLDPYPDSSSAHKPPLAYDPAGNPRPKPLDGTAWQPPGKYRTGAELIRYTLDLNNDGTVDASDLATPDGADARRTKNPNAYVLVRQLYGDSTANTAGNNGGTTERIAIVSKPGGTVPPMYTVYMRGSVTPWDWANGPVPAGQLSNIERIQVQVSAPSSKRDWRGNYANTVMSTTVSSMRNTPSLGPPTYAVDGYVFNDLNHDYMKQGNEPGISGATVRLGNIYTAYTTSNGYFLFRAPAGTYTLRHSPPAGYGVFSQPDSFVAILSGSAVSHSFADTARAGGWVVVHAFGDRNANGIQDVGEVSLAGLQAKLLPGSAVAFTDNTGHVALFAPVGNYSVAITPPDSLVSTTPNPVTGVMVNGGSAAIEYGFKLSATGTIKGEVFRDNNHNGVLDAGEAGLPNVYVAVSSDGGLTIAGYAYTDANGGYSINVPVNDPPHIQAYTLFYNCPPGFFPVGSSAIGNLWVQASSVLTGQNFGVATYQTITLNASRVLSLASTDLIEKDWNGNQTQNARKDADIVLGADAGGTDNVSVWFNDYASTPLFTATPTYTRNAPNSVMSIAIDTLDTAAPVSRPDVVTGTKITPQGNFFVWLNQNTNGNLGYLPVSYTSGYRTTDGGDVQAVLTYDCAGGRMPDIIVGTRSPTAGQGTIEVWQSNDGAVPTYTQQEIYPPAGNIPSGRMGEVTAMTLADIDGDGQKDLIVGTKTGLYSGELLIFKYNGKSNGNRFVCKGDMNINDGQVTSIACADIDHDGQIDIVVGLQQGSATGCLRYFQNKNNLIGFGMNVARTVPTPGIPTALVAGDFGGGSGTDIAMGWRQTDTNFTGGLLIYYTDILNLPFNGVDPSGGTITNFVPAVCASNFNFGVQPSMPPPPYLTDLACGMKSSPTTGALVVFVR
jgi:prepilin-type N-terminal cleavage/methylation domain-containing protein